MTDLEVEAFLVLQESRSISEAAEKLYISQSALSLRLKALEDEIGAPLFYRGKGKRFLEPTTKGRDFYTLAIKYMEIVNRMRRISSLSNNKERLRVCAFDSVNRFLLRRVYEKFTKKNPQVVLEMQDMLTETSYQSVMRGETDLVFTPAFIHGKEVMAKTLFTEKIVFICSKHSDYPKTVSLENLSTEVEVYTEWSSDFGRWHRHTFGEDCVIQYQLAETANLELFLSGKNAWMLAPASVAEELCKAGSVEKRKLSVQIPGRVTNCLYRETGEENKWIKDFMEILSEETEELVEKKLILMKA